MKKILVIIFVFALIGVIWRSVYEQGDLILQDFKHSERFDDDFYRLSLSSKEISTLFKKGQVWKGRFYYYLYRKEEEDNEVKFYGVRVYDGEPTKTSSFGQQINEGVIIVNKKAKIALQQYSVSLVFRGATEGSLIDFYYEDINKDGIKEIMFQGGNGGNVSLAVTIEIFQPIKDGFKQLHPDLDKIDHLGIVEVEDVDQDGSYELIVLDDTWETTECTSHADAPRKIIIYTWQDGFYKDASVKFSERYEEMITQDLFDVCRGEKEFCFGPALQQYFAYKQINREEEGWEKFIALTGGVKNSTFPSKKCRDHVIKLHTENKEITPP